MSCYHDTRDTYLSLAKLKVGFLLFQIPPTLAFLASLIGPM
jgi:hypothetical protein